MEHMDSLTRRVRDLYLVRKADSVGDPKAFLSQFEAKIHELEIPSGQIEDAKRVINETTEAMAKPRDPSAPRVRNMDEAYPGFGKANDLSYKAYFSVTHGGAKLTEPGHKLFLSIIQTLTLPPALRKKVEIASRSYLKGFNPRLKEHGNARYLEMFAVYEKFMTTVRAHLQVAKDAIAKGEAHKEEGPGATKIKIGGFTLVNTGGFDEKTMQNVQDVMQKVEALAKSSGFGEVCYGEVQVTNTLSKNNIAAFYLVASDEMFVRANIKGSHDTVRTVLHELGHRFEYKFMSGKKRDIEHLYHVLSGQEVERKYTERAEKPKPGETMVSKGKTYVVTRTEWSPRGVKVVMQKSDDPKAMASISLEGWAQAKGQYRNFDTNPGFKGFVTDYAKNKGPSENFAEMFSYYCMGRLPVLQSAPFEELVFGSGKTAHDRTTLRVASRWILEG